MYSWTNTTGTFPEVLRRIPNAKLTSRNFRKKSRAIVDAQVKIGKGTYANVYMYYTNRRMKNRIAVKNQSDSLVTETLLHKKIQSIVPMGVPKISSGPNKSKLYIEYIPGGDLFTFIKKNEARMTDEHICMIIVQVVKILQKIHSADSTFRHNDLHLKNILVDDEASKRWNLNTTGVRCVLTDFGLARDSQFPNSQFETGASPGGIQYYKNDYGIYVGNDVMYDTAFFLKSLYNDIPIKFNKVRKLISPLFKGVRLTNNRLMAGEKFGYSFRDIIRVFKAEYETPRFVNERTAFMNYVQSNENWDELLEKVNNKTLKQANIKKFSQIPVAERVGLFLRLSGKKANVMKKIPKPKPKPIKRAINQVRPRLLPSPPRPRAAAIRLPSPPRAAAIRLPSPPRPVVRNIALNRLSSYIKNKYTVTLAKNSLNTYLKMLENINIPRNAKIEKIERVLGFRPRNGQMSEKSASFLSKPAPMRNFATLGAPRVIRKKRSPIKRPSPVRRPTVFTNKVVRSPKSKLNKPIRRAYLSPSIKSLFESPVSPFKRNKFVNSNLSTLTPGNVERYYESKGKTMTDAKAHIERIVRKGRKEAWERARDALAGTRGVSITRQ